MKNIYRERRKEKQKTYFPCELRFVDKPRTQYSRTSAQHRTYADFGSAHENRALMASRDIGAAQQWV